MAANKCCRLWHSHISRSLRFSSGTHCLSHGFNILESIQFHKNRLKKYRSSGRSSHRVWLYIMGLSDTRLTDRSRSMGMWDAISLAILMTLTLQWLDLLLFSTKHLFSYEAIHIVVSFHYVYRFVVMYKFVFFSIHVISKIGNSQSTMAIMETFVEKLADNGYNCGCIVCRLVDRYQLTNHLDYLLGSFSIAVWYGFYPNDIVRREMAPVLMVYQFHQNRRKLWFSTFTESKFSLRINLDFLASSIG